MAKGGGGRKQRLGVVVSNRMNKTVVVRLEVLKRHPLYGKARTIFKKYKAHDEESRCSPGDIVYIKECRPLSRDKHWVVTQIVKSSQGAPELAEEVLEGPTLS